MSTEEAADGERPPYHTACNLIWETDTVAMVSMLNGAMPRSLMREFVEFVAGLGILELHADRAEGHTLPRLFARPGHRATDPYVMDVAKAVEFLRRPENGERRRVPRE